MTIWDIQVDHIEEDNDLGNLEPFQGLGAMKCQPLLWSVPADAAHPCHRPSCLKPIGNRESQSNAVNESRLDERNISGGPVGFHLIDSLKREDSTYLGLVFPSHHQNQA